MNILRILFLLLFIGTSASAQVDIPLFTTHFPAEEFAARRNKVYDAIGKDAITVFQGAPSPAGYVRFRQSNFIIYRVSSACLPGVERG